jgi:6-pyruvoyltetrahydropterin/6-carboxytetrahydropterin synthase
MRVTRRMEFSSSHRLWCDDWDAARNRQVFGTRASREPHGHNYTLDVTLAGPVDEATGMVLDLKQLKAVMEAEVGTRFDHLNMNVDTPYFSSVPPTAENVASVIFALLDAALPSGLLESVALEPDDTLRVEVTR